MLRISKSGKATLDKEVERYREYIIERAEKYASQDDSVDITERHVIKAANDFQNDMYAESQRRTMRNENRKQLSFMHLTLVLCVVFLGFNVLLTFNDMKGEEQKHTLFISLFSGVMAVFVMAITMLELYGNNRRRGKDRENHKQTVLFLNKWNEAESLLRNLYKKKNHKEAGTIKDLLLFYKDIPLVKEKRIEDSLHSMLIIRNNLVHRSLRGVKNETITRLTDEMNEILEVLRASN